MTSVSSNAARVSADLGQFIAETHAVDQMAVIVAARAVTNSLLKLTPPFQSISPLESFAKQRQVGVAAVKRDISRSFIAIDDLRVLKDAKKPLVMKKVQKAVDKQDAGLLATLLTSLNYSNITSDRFVSDATPALHNSLRVRGRVPAHSSSFFVFNKKSIADVQGAALDDIGRGKAGWTSGAFALGITVPQWIARHVGTGTVLDKTGAKVDPSFLATNNVSYLFDFATEYRIVELALGREADSLERQLVARRAGLWEKKKS